MSLQAPVIYCIPDETARVAHAAFPKGNPYLRMRDALGPIYLNPEFTALFPTTGQPAYAPAQLYPAPYQVRPLLRQSEYCGRWSVWQTDRMSTSSAGQRNAGLDW